MMKKLMISAALVLIHLAATPTLAEPAKTTPACHSAQRDCAQTQKQKQATKDSHKTDKKAVAKQGPKRDEVVKDGRALEPREARRLAKPEVGRAYRVVDDRVVLIDQNTLKVVQVLGLATQVLR